MPRSSLKRQVSDGVEPTEDLVEHQTIDWFKEIGYQYACGYDIAHDSQSPERENYQSVILKNRLERFKK